MVGLPLHLVNVLPKKGVGGTLSQVLSGLRDTATGCNVDRILVRLDYEEHTFLEQLAKFKYRSGIR